METTDVPATTPAVQAPVAAPKAPAAAKTANAKTKPSPKPVAETVVDNGGFELRRSITDAGLIAVGIGVLGIQQAQATRLRLVEQISSVTDDIAARAKKSGEQVGEIPSRVSEALSDLGVTSRLGDITALLGEVRTRVEGARERATEIGEQTRLRLAPAVSKLETRVNDLPTPLPQAVAPAVKPAKSLINA